MEGATRKPYPLPRSTRRLNGPQGDSAYQMEQSQVEAVLIFDFSSASVSQGRTNEASWRGQLWS